jgi:hypothetical protein
MKSGLTLRNRPKRGFGRAWKFSCKESHEFGQNEKVDDDVPLAAATSLARSEHSVVLGLCEIPHQAATAAAATNSVRNLLCTPSATTTRLIQSRIVSIWSIFSRQSYDG